MTIPSQVKRMCLVLRPVGIHERWWAEERQGLIPAMVTDVGWRGKGRSRKLRALWESRPETVALWQGKEVERERHR